MNSVPANVSAPPPPLRERWPQILRYPLHPAALSTIVVLALAHLVTILPGVGWFLDFVVWAAFFKYAFEVLRWSANGRDTPPEISLTVSDSISIYAVLLLILIEVLVVVIGVWFGFIAALVVGMALMFAIPAMMMILALEEGPVRAINPLAWLLLGSRIGRQYLILAGFFCAALIVQSVFAAGINRVLPRLITTPLVFIVVNYLMIANFHLIGIVIHVHREELGYTGNLELGDEVPWTDRSRPILEAARGRAAGGDTHGAALLLHDEIVSHPEMLPLHDEYRHWLRQGEENTELAAHGKKYIPVLLAHHQERSAIEVARECKVLDPTFALDDASDITRLAHAAAEAGQTQVALGLISGFHKRFRNHPDIARNYLLAAKLWAERMNKEMQARAMLQQIKLTLPNDPIIPQVDAYIAVLDRVAATPVKPTATP